MKQLRESYQLLIRLFRSQGKDKSSLKCEKTLHKPTKSYLLDQKLLLETFFFNYLELTDSWKNTDGNKKSLFKLSIFKNDFAIAPGKERNFKKNIHVNIS